MGGFAYDEHLRSAQTFARVASDGATAKTDVSGLFADQHHVGVEYAAAVRDRWVGAGFETPDAIAMAGGTEVTIDGITARLASGDAEVEYFDAATDDRIDPARIFEGPEGFEVRDGDGAAVATIGYEQLERLWNVAPVEPVDSRWSVLSTADGVAFSIESIAEIIGQDDSAIHRVARVSSNVIRRSSPSH